MSRVTPAHHPIGERLLRDQRRAKMTALAALTAFAVLIATLVLVIHGDDSPTAATPQPAIQAEQQPPDSPAPEPRDLCTAIDRTLRRPCVAVRPQTGTPDEDGIK
jgi:hypothetical protein